MSVSVARLVHICEHELVLCVSLLALQFLEADDLLDMLSSFDDDFSGEKKAKSKIKLTGNSNRTATVESSTTEGKPITSRSNDVAELDVGESKKDDINLGKMGADQNQLSLFPRQQDKPQSSPGSKKMSAVSFDDDDGNDLLTGLGLDEEREKKRGGEERGGGTGRKGPRTLELAGSPESGEERFKYNRESTLSFDDLSVSKTSASSDVGKKSVRFSDNLVQKKEERPPSSGLPVSSIPKPVLKQFGRKEEKGEEKDTKMEGGRFMHRGLSDVVEVNKSSSDSGAGGVFGTPLIGSKTVSLDLLSRGEQRGNEILSQPTTLSSSQGRRPSPLSLSHSSSLDNSEGEGKGKEFGESPRTPSDLLLEQSGGEKLERPLFPWQKSAQKAAHVSSTPEKPSDDHFSKLILTPASSREQNKGEDEILLLGEESGTVLPRAERSRERLVGRRKSEDRNVEREDLHKALQRVEEAEAALEKERTEHAQCKVRGFT